jgi:membrane protease YdiL (CAAX protease family)
MARESFSEDEQRRRANAPKRVFVFFVTSLASAILLGLAVTPATADDPRWRLPGYFVVLAVGLVAGHAWTFKLVDRRGWSFVGLGRDALRPAGIVTGTLLGALAIGVPAAALLGMGWLEVQETAPAAPLAQNLWALSVLIPASLWEELLLRGYIFASMREMWGDGAALLVTSLLFGIMHLQNAGATAQSVVMVSLAGVFLGSVLIATGSLYAAWAAHLAWNVIQALVFQIDVSGVSLGSAAYRTVDAGPDWATGGAWGPEGGVFAALGIALALAFLYRNRFRRLSPPG